MLKLACAEPGMTLVARVRHRDDGRLQARGLEMRRARVERRRGQAVDDARELGDGVLGALGVGGVALLAVHDERGR